LVKTPLTPKKEDRGTVAIAVFKVKANFLSGDVSNPLSGKERGPALNSCIFNKEGRYGKLRFQRSPGKGKMALDDIQNADTHRVAV
jgi:uncharacterized protein (DUF2141 family)